MEPDRSARRVLSSDWNDDIKDWNMAIIGSEGGCDCAGCDGGVDGGTGSVGSGCSSVGDRGLASWLGGRTSSKPDQGELLSWSRRGSTGGAGEASGWSTEQRLSLEVDRGGGAGGRTASYVWNKEESAQINIRTVGGE